MSALREVRLVDICNDQKCLTRLLRCLLFITYTIRAQIVLWKLIQAGIRFENAVDW